MFGVHYVCEMDRGGQDELLCSYMHELGCLCGKAGTSHLCDGSAHSSGCVVNGSNAMAAV